MSGLVVVPTTCIGVIEPGVCRIEDETLGVLDLKASGFNVTALQIGHPADRSVIRDRALNDGAIDDTAFVGGRAVSLSLRLNNRVTPTQTLLDALRPYLSPRRRPTLVWSESGTPLDERSLTVRGVNAPIQLEGKYPSYAVQFYSGDAVMLGPDTNCITVSQTGLTEAGRAYDLTFDRSYPAQTPVGVSLVTNAGTGPADWVATIFAGSGVLDDPVLTINGIDIAFTGLTLAALQTVRIDTQARTVLLDDGSSAYNLVNYLEWEWADLRLEPGDNTLRLDNTGAGTTSTDQAATLCWRDSWL